MFKMGVFWVNGSLGVRKFVRLAECCMFYLSGGSDVIFNELIQVIKLLMDIFYQDGGSSKGSVLRYQIIIF